MAALTVALASLCALPAAAPAAFPYAAQGDPGDYSSYRLPAGPGQAPSDLQGKLEWMYAATPAPGSIATADARELNGIRGAHVVDDADVDQAWRTTTGRPDVTIAVVDSGIKWNDLAAMRDLRAKTRLDQAEVPVPRADRARASEEGLDCAAFTGDGYDRNRDGVFNVIDYACDTRVDPDPPLGVGPPILDPQDVLIAFSDGTDADGNGYVDDIVGWDFLDDDNDPYDDVQYGHGTGEARDSAAEADNGGDLGTCPNCMQIHMRVGTSFIADVNRFALATVYAVDNGAEVVQEALGTLNKSRLGRQAVDYAWERGVTVIASAADEAAQHNNWPSSYPRVILVNSVTHLDEADALGPLSQSYLQFNGCTNFNAKIDLAIPSVSCSSDATGRAAGMAGLIYSAALNAREAGRLEAHPSCRRVGGEPCALSAAEIKQLMASGSVGGTPQADDVNFAQTPNGVSTELSCGSGPLVNPVCTDPFLAAPTTRGVGTPTLPRSYPARKGHDQFYGYGRVNMNRVLDAIVPEGAGAAPAVLPPEVEITSPEWYDLLDPGAARIGVQGRVWARGERYTCRVLVAPGAYPNNGDAPAGDFAAVPSDVCDGRTERSLPLDGTVGEVDVAALKARFPANAGGFRGPEHGALVPEQPHSGRPSSEPYAVTIRIVADRADGTARGEDRRSADLHRDAGMLDGFPRQLAGDGEASPLLVDLDGDNRNELVIANSDGVVEALERDGSSVPGWPVRVDPIPALHTGGPGFASGAVDEAAGAILATPAAGDLDGDGTLEIVVADLEGRVTVFSHTGERDAVMRTRPEYSGAPLQPFVNVRTGPLQRTQLGFLGSPVLADLDGDGGQEIVAAAMDRHVYAWEPDGTALDGFPVLVVDRAKVAAIDPQTHQVTFRPDAAAEFDQGAIVDTPAVGDLDGDGRPEIVVGTNESYAEPLNAGGLDEAVYGVLGTALSPANGRLFAIRPQGEPGGPSTDSAPWLPGWPFKVGILQAGVLPLVGEGVTGSPVIGIAPCRADATERPRVGVIPAAGLPYLVNPDGQSCLGRPGGKDEALPTYGAVAADQPFLAAFGHPAFGKLGLGTSFLAPAAGVQRALDVVLPEYQGGQDYLASWATRTGRLDPTWPRPVNDLQFLTGPSVGDVDGLPGEEVVAGTSSNDLQAFTAAGTDVPGWPKLTGDWTVANPSLGSFGTLDTAPGARRVVIGLTRSGRVLAYGTGAGACAPASWPRFHHDEANSGDARRDAALPGRPTEPAVAGVLLRFVSPGDDLMCGTPARYEVRTSTQPITPASFAAADPVTATGPAVRAGARAALALSGRLRRYVAVRAVDEQGNAGLPAVADRGPAGNGGGPGLGLLGG